MKMGREEVGDDRESMMKARLGGKGRGKKRSKTRGGKKGRGRMKKDKSRE